MTTSLRFHILSCFSIPGGLSTVYGLTLAAQGAPRYSVAALLTRPPRKTCSLRCTRSGLSTVYGLTLAAQGASRYSVAVLLTRPPRKTCSLRFHILSCFSILGGLSTVYGLTLAAQGAPRYSVAALLTRPPRKTCSLRRVVARKYQKNIAAFAKISDIRVKFVAFSIRSCYNSSRTWGYSSVGRALASHVRGQGFDSPYLHHLPKDPNIRVFFFLFRADGGDKGSAP